MEDALAAIDDWVARGLVPGAAAVVVDAGGVLAERYAGVRERGGDDAVRADTLFALASLTKPLLGTACMVALEEGLLELDAEVRDGFALRHLLSHCAGLPVPGLQWQEPPGYPPGTQRWYSNAGYMLAAKLLEGASGISCAAYLNEAVLAPLGMDASLGLAESEAGRAARVWQSGRYGEGELFNSERFRRDAPPQGGGFATARAYGTFVSCLLAGGDSGGRALLAPETVDELLSPQFGPLPGGVEGVGEWPSLCWGLGFDVRGHREPHWSGSSLSPRTASHFGASGTLAWLDPELRIGLVALANRGSYSGWWREPWAALGDAVTSAAAAA
ncbi:MAG TPA: serine hydrolase domain-containing protein [Gaiellales bacterium]|nr:serine hydrolase domain-containing protein [Gaiellales bacterium]